MQFTQTDPGSDRKASQRITIEELEHIIPKEPFFLKQVAHLVLQGNSTHAVKNSRLRCYSSVPERRKNVIFLILFTK